MRIQGGNGCRDRPVQVGQRSHQATPAGAYLDQPSRMGAGHVRRLAPSLDKAERQADPALLVAVQVTGIRALKPMTR